MNSAGLVAVFALAAAFALGSGAVFKADGGTSLRHPVNDNAGSAIAAEQRIGGIMPDGTVFAGALDGKAIFTTTEDAPGTYTWNKAGEYCARLPTNPPATGAAWNVPTKSELNVLFTNRAVIGGFNETGTLPAGQYWSSTDSEGGYVSVESFNNGSQYVDYMRGQASLRCVRG